MKKNFLLFFSSFFPVLSDDSSLEFVRIILMVRPRGVSKYKIGNSGCLHSRGDQLTSFQGRSMDFISGILIRHFSRLDNLKKLHLEPLSSVSSPAKAVASSTPNLIAIFPIKRRIRTTGHRFFSFLHFFRI